MRVLAFACFTLFFRLSYSQSLVIENVNLIDVRTGKILPGMSVVVDGETISEIAVTQKVKAPADATVIRGEGKFLMPGLIDSHIHFFQSGSLYTRPDALRFDAVPYEKEKSFVRSITPDHLTRYLRLGITTVADVGGPMWNFTVRDSISKAMPSPNVFVTGPLFSMVSREALGKKDPPIVKITTPAQADSLFARMLPKKPDFIKVWYISGPQMPAEKNFELVRHIARRAHENQLKLCVHATQHRTAELAVDAGANILVHSIDTEVVSETLLRKLKDNKVTVIPTLTVFHGYSKTMARQLNHDPQDLAWANPFAYRTLNDPEKMDIKDLPPVMRQRSASGLSTSEMRADSIMRINLRKLVSAGVNVATGTDAGNIGTLHASSYLQELKAMIGAGLSAAEVLRASTCDAATGFGWQRLGAIEKGKWADMILLEKNPLEKIDHLNSISHVVKSGKVMRADTLLKESPETVVQRQLNAYNARNLEAFLDTYSDDIELYDFPNRLTQKGKEEMRKRYGPRFESTPNLYCELVNRIVMGNTVIDQEKVRVGSNTIRAVAIYEVNQGKIRKVTFVRP